MDAATCVSCRPSPPPMLAQKGGRPVRFQVMIKAAPSLLLTNVTENGHRSFLRERARLEDLHRASVAGPCLWYALASESETRISALVSLWPRKDSTAFASRLPPG